MKCQKCNQEIIEGEWVVAGYYENGRVIHRDHLTIIGKLWSGVSKGFSIYQYHHPIPVPLIIEREPMSTKDRIKYLLLLILGAALSSGAVWLILLTSGCGLEAFLIPECSITSTGFAWTCTFAWPLVGGFVLAIWAFVKLADEKKPSKEE
jgi:hypothetical protein